MNLRDVDLYLKRRALAEGNGDPNEKANAARQVREMESEHPGIRAAADRVQRALEGAAPAGAAPPGGWKGGVADWLRRTAEVSAERFADELAGEVSGADRFKELRRGECRLSTHTCAAGQVCLEIRVRARDVASTRVRERVLDGVEAELLRLADEAE